MAAHRSSWVEPISAGYRGLEVYELPPPTTGIAALMILRALEREDMGALDPLGAERIHLEVEAEAARVRRAARARRRPGLRRRPVAALLAGAASAAAERAPAGRGDGDTTYLCAVDAEGNGCSLINSLYKGVRQRRRRARHRRLPARPRLRLLARRASPSVLAPGKRPLHTIIPALVTRDGALWAVYGNMGGFMQPQGHAQVLGNLHDHGMTAAGGRRPPAPLPRRAASCSSRAACPRRRSRKLRRWGHDVVRSARAYAEPTGGAQVVRLHADGVRAAGSDPRKDGCALAQ